MHTSADLSLALLAESRRGSRGVRWVQAQGGNQHSGYVTKPWCTGTSQTLRQAYVLSPLRHTQTHVCVRTHTHLSLKHTDNLSISIKKPNSVIAKISPLVEVCECTVTLQGVCMSLCFGAQTILVQWPREALALVNISN